MSVQTRKIIYDFRGALKPPAVANREGVWVSKITGASNNPTVQSSSGGPLELTLTADNEVQNLCLYMGDILPFDIDDLIRIEWLARVSAGLAASVSAAIGVASARNDTLDTVAEHAWFRLQGNNNLLCETDDGTTDVDDAATGQTLVATYKRLAIDFSEGGLTQSPPSQSLGAKADVRFFAGDANSNLRRVAANQRFRLDAYAGNLQLFAQIQKTAAVATGTLSLLEASVEYRLPA